MASRGRRVRLLCHDLIERFFRGSPYRTKDSLAKALRVTPAHVTQLLRSPERGGRIPSRIMVERLARVCGRTKAQREFFRRLLYQARWAVEFSRVPPVVSEAMLPPLQMPTVFRERLRQDLMGFGIGRQREVARAADVSYRHLREVLRGAGLFDRWQVTRIAKQLHQDPGVYLVLAGYLEPSDRPLVSETPATAALATLSRPAFNELFEAMFGLPDQPQRKGRRARALHLYQ